LVQWLPTVVRDNKKNWDSPLLGGPFDGNDEEGEPLIAEASRRNVLQRLHIITAKAPASAARPSSRPSSAQP
jgi:hypothetical protein